MSRVPRIRFKGFEEDWEQRKLKDFGKATGGISIESEFDEYGKYKVISIGSYSEESKYTDQGIRVYKTKKTESRILNKNDLVMILNDKTSSGNIIGRVLLVDKDNTYVYNQRTERIEINKSKFLPEYLYQLLNSDNIRIKIICASQGNTQIYVNWTVIREFTYIITTDIEEQGKIARFFITLDHLITLHQRKLEKLKIIKKSMLENLFPQSEEKTPKIRFSGFTKDWEQRKLGEVADIIGGGTPSTLNSDYWDGNIDWYSPAEIIDQIYMYKSQRKITELGLEKSSAKMLPIGTVLFTSRAGIGKTAILAKRGCTNQGFQSIVPYSNTLDSYFIFSRTEELKKYGELVGAGSTFVEVSGRQMENMQLMIPKTIGEQHIIGLLFSTLDHLITLHQSKLEKLQKIKKSMLESMFV